MLETIGQFGLQYSEQAQGDIESLSEEWLCLESPLTFQFYLLREKSSKNKKPLIDSSQKKAVHENYISGFGDQVTYREGTSYEEAPL